MKLIHASSLGRLMANDSTTSITEKQLITLNTLLTKIKLTDKQATLRDDLEAKRDAPPQLSAGAKTYVQELYLYDKFGIRQEIDSKYIDKGNIVEDASIELARIVLDLDEAEKNEIQIENDYLIGTPDVWNDKVLLDVKSSWSASTFPFFDTHLKNKMYEWQLKAYMWLTEMSESYLVYCLVQTPEILIQDEIRRTSWKRGEIDISDETDNDVREFHNIDHIPAWDRVKSFKVELTDEDISQMKDKIELARIYYKSINK